MKKVLISEAYATTAAMVLACIVSSSAFSQQNKIEAVDLSSLPSVEIKSGALTVMDTYKIRELESKNGQNLVLSVVQNKRVSNTKSCGVLENRYVEFSEVNTKSKVQIDINTFSEFYAVKNYLQKFMSSWDLLNSGKSKTIYYQFANETERKKTTSKDKSDLPNSLFLSGDKQNITLGVTDSDRWLFSSRELREIQSFFNSVDAVSQFLETHPFDECL